MNLDFKALAGRIEQIMLDYVAVRSDTYSPCERDVEVFWRTWLDSVPYFRQNPGLCGLHPIPGDHLGRHVGWCLRKGRGADTVVFIHHSDCVETTEYGVLEDVCLSPYQLEKAYIDRRVDLPEDAAADLASGQWIFGRGVNDMKGGGAIQMALVEQYCADSDFAGNVIILAVPDEEHLSAGMIAACQLLGQLKDSHGLNYAMMLDTESHERQDPLQPIIYDGSVGKVMPVVYVRGKLAHVGQVFGGFNPIGLLGEIVRRTELNPFFIEKVGNTVCPPATWLYGKDCKQVYDVSLPVAACGYMSVLPLAKTPMEIMDKVKELSAEAMDSFINRMNESYGVYLDKCGQPAARLPWQQRVLFFSQLYDEALRDGGSAFEAEYSAVYSRVKQGFRQGEVSTIDGATMLIEAALRHVKDLSPVVVVAMAPPYYPSVNNAMLPDNQRRAADAALAAAMAWAEEELGQKYSVCNYYTGISDLSYAMFKAEPQCTEYIKGNMLLWGDIYSIPLETIARLSMPVCNIGPWGKDIHKYTERVYRQDLFENTPMIINRAVMNLLGQN